MITDKGVAVPDDMAAALEDDAEALQAFGRLQSSDQRVYVDWVRASTSSAERVERLTGLGDHVRAYQRRPAEEHGSPHPLLDV